MNKKYMVDENSRVTVITNTGETIERTDKYTKNTDEILSLENAVEGFDNKINIFKNKLKELISKIKGSKISIMLLIPLIGANLFCAILAIMGNAVTIEFAIRLGIILLAAIGVTEIIEIRLLTKNNSKKRTVNQRITEMLQTKNRVQKRIATLSEDKTIVEAEKINQFIDVKSTTNFNFDARDYFIENYLINNRAKQMTRQEGKIKKRVLTKTDNKYII